MWPTRSASRKATRRASRPHCCPHYLLSSSRIPAAIPTTAASLWLVTVIGLCLGGIGCSRKPPVGELASVSGQVTLDGRPLAGGCVTFVPELAETDGFRPGVTQVNVRGEFEIGGAEKRPRGLRPGRYKITVLAMQRNADDPNAPIAELALPEAYVDPQSTPLSADLHPGNNQVDLRLATEPDTQHTGVVQATAHALSK